MTYLFAVIHIAKDTIIMISKDLLTILCCPETKQDVAPIDDTTLEHINQKIRQGTLKNRADKPVKEEIHGALLREDGKYIYPVREDIPIMLIDEAIDTSQFDTAPVSKES